MRLLPFLKPTKGVQIAGGGFPDSGGGGGSYTLPPATANRLGGVKVGSGLSVTGDGTLSASGGGGGGSFDYSTTEFNTGQKWIDGKDIYGIVVEYTLPSSNGQIAIATINNVDTFITAFGSVYGLDSGGNTLNSVVLPQGNTALSFRNDSNAFRIDKQNTALNDWLLLATAFYTKTS